MICRSTATLAQHSVTAHGLPPETHTLNSWRDPQQQGQYGRDDDEQHKSWQHDPQQQYGRDGDDQQVSRQHGCQQQKQYSAQGARGGYKFEAKRLPKRDLAEFPNSSRKCCRLRASLNYKIYRSCGEQVQFCRLCERPAFLWDEASARTFEAQHMLKSPLVKS